MPATASFHERSSKVSIGVMRRDFQAEARFARTLLQHEVPAGIASGSFHFVDGEIEAEEEDVICGRA